MEIVNKITPLDIYINSKKYNKLETDILYSKSNSELIENMKNLKKTYSDNSISKMISSHKMYFMNKISLTKKKTKSGRNVEIQKNKTEGKKVLLNPLDLIVNKDNIQVLNAYIKLFHPTRNTMKSSIKYCKLNSQCYNIIKKQLDKEPLHKKLLINKTNAKILQLCKEYKKMSDNKKQQLKSIYKKFCNLHI